MNWHFGGVVNALPCYFSLVRQFLRERVFESHRCRQIDGYYPYSFSYLAVSMTNFIMLLVVVGTISFCSDQFPAKGRFANGSCRAANADCISSSSRTVVGTSSTEGP